MQIFSTCKVRAGFTLLEMLIIMLIIGILAAVALPQYQNAVMHSRYSQQQLTVGALRSAAQRYYMANSLWPDDFSLLDIDFPASFSEDGSEMELSGGRCVYYPDDGGHNPAVACYTVKGPEVGYLGFYINDWRFCLAPSGDERSQTFCQTLGGEALASSTVPGMTQYTIP